MQAIGVDLGGTKVFGVRMTGGEVTDTAKRKTPSSGGPDAVVAMIASVVDDLGGTKHLEHVGVGAPGAVDHERGVVRRAPNLPGWDCDVPLAELLSDALDGVNVSVENDVNAATFAESRLGAAAGEPDVLGVWVGTGVGGGLVLDGALRRGPGGWAGEIGHITVHPGGRPCGCGGVGHLEAYAGRAGLEREARARHTGGTPTALVDIAGDKRMTSSVFEQALQAADPVAMALLDDAVEALGLALAATVTLLDLPLVVLGGGLAERLGPTFAGRVEQAVRSSLYAEAAPLRIVAAALGDECGAIGAAMLAGERG